MRRIIAVFVWEVVMLVTPIFVGAWLLAWTIHLALGGAVYLALTTKFADKWIAAIWNRASAVANSRPQKIKLGAAAIAVAVSAIFLPGPILATLYGLGVYGEPANNRFVRVHQVGFNQAGRYGWLFEFGVRYAPLDGVKAGVALAQDLEPEVDNFWFAASGLYAIPPQHARHEPGMTRGFQDFTGAIISDTGPTPNRSFYVYLETAVAQIDIERCFYSAASEIGTENCADLLGQPHRPWYGDQQWLR